MRLMIWHFRSDWQKFSRTKNGLLSENKPSAGLRVGGQKGDIRVYKHVTSIRTPRASGFGKGWKKTGFLFLFFSLEYEEQLWIPVEQCDWFVFGWICCAMNGWSSCWSVFEQPKVSPVCSSARLSVIMFMNEIELHCCQWFLTEAASSNGVCGWVWFWWLNVTNSSWKDKKSAMIYSDMTTSTSTSTCSQDEVENTRG